MRPGQINGQPASSCTSAPALAAMILHIRDGRIRTIYAVGNPDKLHGLVERSRMLIARCTRPAVRRDGAVVILVTLDVARTCTAHALFITAIGRAWWLAGWFERHTGDRRASPRRSASTLRRSCADGVVREQWQATSHRD